MTDNVGSLEQRHVLSNADVTLLINAAGHGTIKVKKDGCVDLEMQVVVCALKDLRWRVGVKS